MYGHHEEIDLLQAKLSAKQQELNDMRDQRDRLTASLRASNEQVVLLREEVLGLVDQIAGAADRASS